MQTMIKRYVEYFFFIILSFWKQFVFQGNLAFPYVFFIWCPRLSNVFECKQEIVLQ